MCPTVGYSLPPGWALAILVGVMVGIISYRWDRWIDRRRMNTSRHMLINMIIGALPIILFFGCLFAMAIVIMFSGWGL